MVTWKIHMLALKGGKDWYRGFTLIELLVVLSIIALLLTIAVPRYFGSLENAKEVALKKTLAEMRNSIDQHLGDTGRYPATLNDLVTRKYLRFLPVDPMTERNDTWRTTIAAPSSGGGVVDIRSGAEGTSRDGSSFDSW
jgi:general secretion pathway protein G